MSEPMKVDLGFVFQPLAFLSAIGKNIVNFLTPGPAIFPKVISGVAPPASAAATIASIAPWTVSSVVAPSSAAAATIAKIASEVAPTSLATFLPKYITPEFVAKYAAPAEYVAKQLATGPIWQESFKTAMDAIGGSLSTILSFFMNKQQAEAATEIAKSEAEAERRVAAVTVLPKAEEPGIVSKAIPYVIPITAGLAIVALLLLVSKGKEKKGSKKK